MVPEEGVEPTQSKAPADFESAASASSATPGLPTQEEQCVWQMLSGSAGLRGGTANASAPVPGQLAYCQFSHFPLLSVPSFLSTTTRPHVLQRTSA